jgi:prepilin-type N-terminal cleavage/methylation domain-containing protein
MNKKGFTLIEVVLSLSILCIIAVISIDFIKLNDRVFYNISDSIDRKSNLRIAMEFLYRTIRDCDSIEILSNGIKVDNERIYIKNNILRYSVDSQQIAPNITNFSVDKITDILYKIHISSEDAELITFVKVRNN